MSYHFREFRPTTDVLKPFDCGKADLNGFLLETDTGTPNTKRRSSYPSLKIGRLAVDKKAQSSGLGHTILTFVKGWFFKDAKAGCRFLTVDAYLDAEDFYAKCTFKPLTIPEPEDETVLMFFDLMSLQ